MDKLKMQNINKANENFKKLSDMFLDAVTETVVELERLLILVNLQ